MTNLFLTTISMLTGVPSGAEAQRWKLASAAGVVSTVCNKNGAAGPTAPLKITDSSVVGSDGSVVAWYSDPLQAVTVAGAITCSLWTKESANTANMAPTVGIYRCDAAGVELATIVAPTLNLGAAEMATTAGGATDTISVTAANVTDTAIAAGERLKVALFIDDAADQGGAGSMSGTQNAQFWVNGPTGAAGQAQIAFTETILGLTQTVVDPTFAAVAGRITNPGREAPTIYN